MTEESPKVRLIISLRNNFAQIVKELNDMLKDLEPGLPTPARARATFGLSEEDLALVDIIKDPQGRGTIIKPKRYLADKWAPIRDKLEPQGFKWVSAGKESHWKDWD